MMSPAETEAVRERFLAPGIAAFGREGIEEILDVLDEGMILAARELALPTRAKLRGIKVIADPARQASMLPATGRHSMGLIDIELNAAASVEQVVAIVDRVAIHEIAHWAHMLQPEVRDEWRVRDSFNVIIKEGVASHIERTLTHESYWPGNFLNLSSGDRAAYGDVLIHALYDDDPYETALNLRHNTHTKADIYTVGTYVVGVAAELYELTPLDVLAVNFGTWRDFAEAEL